jgi:hypothetical protein
MRDKEKEIIKLKTELTTFKRSALEVKEEPLRKESSGIDT